MCIHHLWNVSDLHIYSLDVMKELNTIDMFRAFLESALSTESTALSKNS